ACLKAGGDKAPDGLALLRKAAADNANAVAAASAKLELILYELSLGVTVERAEPLSQWLLANPKHPQASAIVRFAPIVADLEKLGTDPAITKAAGLQGQLLAGLSPDAPQWAGVLHREVDLLDNLAQRTMTENQRTGNGAKNEKLSDTQKLIVDLLAKAAAKQPDASKAIERLDAHLRNWITAGYFATAEEGFTLLAQAVAPSQQRMVRLAVIRVWTAQVLHHNERMQAAGFTPPHQLDATLGKALRELYSLQAGLTETDQQLFEVRRHWTAIIAHYRRMEWFDVAEQAITVKADAAVPAADAHAMLTLAGLREAQARAEFDRTAKQLDAAKKLALTPGFRAAIETYQKFITTFPANPNTSVAANAILDIGRLYEQRGAFDVAVEVYRGLATFAAGQKSLAAPTPNTAGMADQASLAVAAALDAKARQALTKWAAERKADTAPPGKLSDEFAAALGVYKDFLKTRSASPLAGTATAKIQAAALEYAKVDGWDVADGIYTDLLAAGLPLKSPERIELARAMCILGKVMPQDAIEVLARLSQGAELKPSARPAVTETSIALMDQLKQQDLGAQLEALDIKIPKPVYAGAPRSFPQGIIANNLTGAEVGDLQTVAPDFSVATRGAADESDIAALAAVTQNESRRAAQVAALRDGTFQFGGGRAGGGGGFGGGQWAANGPAQQPAQQMDRQGQARLIPVPPVLSEAELARITGVFDNAYKAFAALRLKYPTTTVADLARAEMLAMVNHWRTLAQWQRGAALGERYVGDYLTDVELPKLRLQIARDYLSHATLPPKPDQKRQDAMAELGKRFDKARVELKRIVDDFPDKLDLIRDAQWDIAASFLAQARTVDGLSPTLSRGQYVRAARELQKLARQYAEHPRMAEVPQLLAQIAAELAGRGHAEEAIIVWQDLVNFDPTHGLAQQSGPLIASTYQSLNRPLRAVETWMELNFARGGNDQAAQNAIFQIGTQLKNEKRWAEALGVLETFVDSFPKHASAGQALTMIGQIHQANEAWEDAIAAYKRVINEFPSGNWIQEAKWAIAECTINLSQWREAIGAYEAFAQAYPQDPKVAEANRRIGILKDLARYQTVVDEPGQRKNFDAQFQIGTIIQT
ncbi:MAG: tetratricopeptide repeat protein, partial [Tepidisphaeraceae bacterium]